RGRYPHRRRNTRPVRPPGGPRAARPPCYRHAPRHATVISFDRYTSWMALRRAMPSLRGRWNALRPEIRPVPAARLLITAVLTASARSLAPFDSPPELIRPHRPM